MRINKLIMETGKQLLNLLQSFGILNEGFEEIDKFINNLNRNAEIVHQRILKGEYLEHKDMLVVKLFTKLRDEIISDYNEKVKNKIVTAEDRGKFQKLRKAIQAYDKMLIIYNSNVPKEFKVPTLRETLNNFSGVSLQQNKITLKTEEINYFPY